MHKGAGTCLSFREDGVDAMPEDEDGRDGRAEFANEAEARGIRDAEFARAREALAQLRGKQVRDATIDNDAISIIMMDGSVYRFYGFLSAHTE